MTHALASLAARMADVRGIGPILRDYLGRSFGAGDRTRVAIYGDFNRISFAQVYPFLSHAADFEARFGARIRFFPLRRDGAEGLLDAAHPADIVLFQPWFTVSGDQIGRSLDRLRALNPATRFAFLDSYAHSDIRLARHLPDDLLAYLKKSLLADRSGYLRSWKGDTNLSEYYGDLYGIAAEPVDWQAPAWVLDRLRLSPNFFTAPHLAAQFTAPRVPDYRGRQIDLHARLATGGTPWYAAMRQAAIAAVQRPRDLAVVSQGIVPRRRFQRELADSRLCFSPFGYGELCWRDIEAIAAGSVLIKPDMSHLETLPDLYEPGVTYLPVRWDFADLEEVVRHALADEERCAAIAAEAWARVAGYLRDRRFVSDMSFLFSAA